MSLWLLSAVSLASHLNPIKRQRGQTGLKKCRDYANPAAPWRVPWIDRMVQRVTKGHLPPELHLPPSARLATGIQGFCNQVLACRCYGKMRGSELSHSEASLPTEAMLPKSVWDRWVPGSHGPPPPAPATQPPPPTTACTSPQQLLGDAAPRARYYHWAGPSQVK